MSKMDCPEGHLSLVENQKEKELLVQNNTQSEFHPKIVRLPTKKL